MDTGDKGVTRSEILANKNAAVEYNGSRYILRGCGTITVPRKGTWLQVLLQDERHKWNFVRAKAQDVKLIEP